MSVVLTIESLPVDVICLFCLSQLIEGSGIPNALHVISKRPPGSIVTRVPITTETGFKFCICSTDDVEISISGNVASAKQKYIVMLMGTHERIQINLSLKIKS